MGREGKLPGPLGRLHHRYETPFVAVLSSAAVMLVAVESDVADEVVNLLRG